MPSCVQLPDGDANESAGRAKFARTRRILCRLCMLCLVAGSIVSPPRVRATFSMDAVRTSGVDRTDTDDIVHKVGPFEDKDACVRHFEDDDDVSNPHALCEWMAQQEKEDLGEWDPDEDSLKDLVDALTDPQAQKVLENLKVTFVSGVSNPAQDSAWVTLKDEDGNDWTPDWGVTVPLLVRKGLALDDDDEDDDDDDEDEEQKAMAPVLIPNETDKQGDVIPPQEVERAAHEFLKYYRNIDTDHDLLSGAGEVVESYTLDEAKTFSRPDGSESREYPAGTWMMMVEFDDDAWERVKSGDLTGFSIYGEAENTPVAEIVGMDASDAGVDVARRGVAMQADGGTLAKNYTRADITVPVRKLFESEQDLINLLDEIDLFVSDTAPQSEDISLLAFVEWLESDHGVGLLDGNVGDVDVTESLAALFAGDVEPRWTPMDEGDDAPDMPDDPVGDDESVEQEKSNTVTKATMGDTTDETEAENEEAQTKDEGEETSDVENETDSVEETLKSIQSTVEDTQESVSSVKSSQEDLAERVDALEKEVGLDEGEDTSDEEKAESDDAGGDETDVSEEAEKAVAKFLGLDVDELPEDEEERQAIVRKAAFETDDGTDEVGSPDDWSDEEITEVYG